MNKLLPIASVLVLSGCPFLELEAEVGEVCVTHRDVMIEGVTLTSVQTSFTAADLGQLGALVEQQDADLEFVRAELRATSLASVGFVDTAKVTIASGDPEATLPSLSIIECDGDCLPEGPTLRIPAAVQHSAIDYIATGSFVVDVELQGHLPTEAWTADIDLCMKGRVGYAFDPTN